MTQVEAEQVSFNVSVVHVPDEKHSEAERRFHVLGQTNEGRLLYITFTLRFGGRKIRVISARAMHRTERRIYEEKAQNNSQV